MKVENILLSTNFDLKVADFGFAILFSDNGQKGQLKTTAGTPMYMAPEIEAKKPYSGPAVDLFACSVILFVLVSGCYPFNLKANPRSDEKYRLLFTTKTEKFWEEHEKYMGKGFYSKEFKEFLTIMFSWDPAVRLTIPEIKSHPWYNGATLPKEELCNEFSKRKKMVDRRIQKQKQAKEQQKLIAQAQNKYVNTNVFTGIRPYRSLFGEIEPVHYIL